MVVAQFVERSLPTPEIHGSNPVIGKIYIYSTLVKRRKWRKWGREWPIFLKKLSRPNMCHSTRPLPFWLPPTPHPAPLIWPQRFKFQHPSIQTKLAAAAAAAVILKAWQTDALVSKLQTQTMEELALNKKSQSKGKKEGDGITDETGLGSASAASNKSSKIQPTHKREFL